MSKFVGAGPSAYKKKRIYLAAVSQRLRNTDLKHQIKLPSYDTRWFKYDRD